MDRKVKWENEVETVETWQCQRVFILKALWGRNLFTPKPTKTNLRVSTTDHWYCDLVEAATVPPFLSVL